MSTNAITLIGEDGNAVSVAGAVEGGTLRVDAEAFAEITGWRAKPEGLCRDDVCIPVSLWPTLVAGGQVDLAVFAESSELPVVVDATQGIAALGRSAAQRHDELATLEAPSFVARGLDGEEIALRDFAGRKKLLVSFASWCGCRYDLPAWQELHDELSPHGLSLIAVAVDETPEDARPWVDEASVTFPVVLDRDHVVCEAYDVRNVPTVVWIDEHDHIVRPNDVAFGTDAFKEFHGVESSPHHEALRRWVLDDEPPLPDDEISSHQVFPTDDEQRARLHFRVAIELHRAGDDTAAAEHFARAAELSPDDFTVRRAAMPLQGIDPFLSEEFIALWESYRAHGGYNYGFEHVTPPK